MKSINHGPSRAIMKVSELLKGTGGLLSLPIDRQASNNKVSNKWLAYCIQFMVLLNYGDTLEQDPIHQSKTCRFLVFPSTDAHS